MKDQTAFLKRMVLGWACAIMMVIQACKSDPGHKFTNALIHETSPYLLQHAHNPVDWRPWSESVWEDAKVQDKLVIISVGYSSCHWCHVMEDETFEDEEVAQLMNENFISVKVDREERPDVDQVYMTATQLLTGSGGWPLNVIALPDGKPLYGGTYHTKTQWVEVLGEISKMYKEDAARAYQYGDRVAQGIQAVNFIEKPEENSPLEAEDLKKGMAEWREYWDLEWGGQTTDQKFMMPGNLLYLLHYAKEAGDSIPQAFVKTTLDKMMQGGLMDQIGGGFYRYSTDAYWKIPHFEKMLYDNAQALSLYAAGYKIFRDPEYQNVIEQTMYFLDREMSNGAGAYYAALDADSEGEEGKYYVWTTQELQSILQGEYELFSSYYGINPGSAWEDDRYVLFREVPDVDFCQANALESPEFLAKKAKWNEKLLNERSKRAAPGLDDKIITSWNALLITGMVDAFEATGERAYLQKARSIYDFLKAHNEDEAGLVHTYKEGGKRNAGFLEDYAFLIQGALKLYSATGEILYLDDARTLHAMAEEKFSDEASGLYRFNENNELIATVIKTNDDVIPSANAVMAQNAMVLGHIHYDKALLEESKNMLTAVWKNSSQNPENYSRWNTLAMQFIYPYFEIAVVGTESHSIAPEIRQEYLPNTLVVQSGMDSELPLFKGRYSDGETYIYVCRNNTCKLPVQTTEAALAQLASW